MFNLNLYTKYSIKLGLCVFIFVITEIQDYLYLSKLILSSKPHWRPYIQGCLISVDIFFSVIIPEVNRNLTLVFRIL